MTSVRRTVTWILLYCTVYTLGCDDTFNEWAAQHIKSLDNNYKTTCNILSGGNLTRADATGFSNIKIFMFQKDESELLSDWLQYHSFLFGLQNIHVVDHSSTKPEVCKLLALYRECGASITTLDGPFSLKHTTLTKVMQAVGPKKFLVPLDADEFIVLPTRRTNTSTIDRVYFEPTAVREAIHRLPIDGRKYKFGGVYPVQYDKQHCEEALVSNHTRRALSGGMIEQVQYRPHHTKTFYYSDGFIETDQGNHYGSVAHDTYSNGDRAIKENISIHYVVSELALLHLSVSSYGGMKSKMLRGADAYHYTDDTDCDKATAGAHYCKYAKWFREGGPKSHEFYTKECLFQSINASNVVRLDTFRDWFAHHALSLSELVGGDE